MKKLQINENQKALIISVIKESPKFLGHDELLDEIVDAVYKKSYLLMDAIKDMSRLRRHLSTITDSTVDAILKEKKILDEARLFKQIKENARKTQNIISLKNNVDRSFDNQNNPPKIVNLRQEIKKSEKFDGLSIFVDPKDSVETKEIPLDTMDKFIRIIKTIDQKFPDKKYFEIFTLRYLKNYSQGEIAKMMHISKTELAKRFMELIELTSSNV